MPLLRPSFARYAKAAHSGSRNRQAARKLLNERAPAAPFPVIPKCPSPTCECADTPADLDIERSRDLSGTIPPYSQHLIIPSGQSDWTSRIEDERDHGAWGKFTANVRGALSRGGEFHDPFNAILISTSSFIPWESKAAHDQSQAGLQTADAILFPAFQYATNVNPAGSGISTFVRSLLLPETLHPLHGDLSEAEKARRTRAPELINTSAIKITSVRAPTILICSHATRDSRCGILGPLLHAEFTRYISERKSTMHKLVSRSQELACEEKMPAPEPGDKNEGSGGSIVNLGMISHVGGHKWAGNVIVYVPPGFPGEDGQAPHPLGGMGIWYGRVEPRHVEGIVEETLIKGRVIRDLFRGGIAQDGTVLRL